MIGDGYNPPQAYYFLAKEYQSVGNGALATQALESYFKALPETGQNTQEYFNAVSMAKDLMGKK